MPLLPGWSEAMGAPREVHVPDIGDFKDVPVIEVLVRPGDVVAKDTPLVVLETDKATMEVPSPVAGTVRELHIQLGDRLSRGNLLMTLDPQSLDELALQTKASSPPESINSASEAPQKSVVDQPPTERTTSAGGVHEVLVPDIGDFKDVPVIEVLVQVGDQVAENAALIVLETDKATMEVPSPRNGRVQEIKVKVGDRLSKGQPLLILQSDSLVQSVSAADEKTAAPSVSSVQASARRDQADTTLPSQPPQQKSAVRASPAIRKRARELGVDLSKLSPSGTRGRITQSDIDAHIRNELAQPKGGGAESTRPALLPWPEVDFSKFGEIERQPLSRLRKISGANLARNWALIPHVTNFDEADITELEAFRVQLNQEQRGQPTKLTMLAFLIKAVVEVLRQFPDFNASLDGEELVLKRYFNIGFAADTPNGLVVPVIHNADKKGLRDIAQETAELAALARAGKLKPNQMQGGCFSISSLGGIGGTGFTPIINAPEVAILGVTRAELKPKWDGSAFRPRLMLPLNLSWDHRVIDGASAARFLVQLCALLADFRRVSL